MSGEFYYWGPFVYKTNIDDSMRENLIEISKDLTIDFSSTLAGRLEKQLKYERNEKELYEYLLQPFIQEYVESLYLDFYGKPPPPPAHFFLDEVWLNRQKAKEHNPLHSHAGDISFVLYLDVPEEISKEEYIHRGAPNGSLNFAFGEKTVGSNNNDNILSMLQPKTEMELQPKTGELIIFPSYLNHYVQSFDTEGIERWSVSGNFFITENKE